MVFGPVPFRHCQHRDLPPTPTRGTLAHWPLDDIDVGAADVVSGQFDGVTTNATVHEGAPDLQCGGASKEWTVYVLPSHCGVGTEWDPTLEECVAIADTTGSEPEDCPPSCGPGTVWDPINEECIIAIPTDNDLDGCVSASDVLNLLSTFGTCPPIPEWPEEADNTWTCGDPSPTGTTTTPPSSSATNAGSRRILQYFTVTELLFQP